MFSIISKGQKKRQINDFYKKLTSKADPSSSFCKVYAPKIFASLRKTWGVSEEDFAKELAKVKGGKTGAGKSKMLMWTSKTGRLFLKTMSLHEITKIMEILDTYVKYMKRNNKSLLPKFLGIYMEHGVYFLVQNNLQYGLEKSNSWVYDIKGSHRHRTTEFNKKNYVGKDNNFGSSSLYFPHAKQLLRQMKKDSLFLSKNSLMDYSLLVILNTNTKQCPSEIYQFKGSNPSPKVNTCIHIGIIDILQTYNLKKKLERFYKTKRIFKVYKSEVSALDPKNYKRRFDKFCKSIVKTK